jgi:flagellar hook-associated protein 1 FlgK
MSISRVYDIARRSLAVYQKNLDVTSHNIANAGNTDYSRQRTVLTSDIPEFVNGFIFGSGVKIQDVQRARDTLLDKQIINYNQKYSSDEKQSSILPS